MSLLLLLVGLEAGGEAEVEAVPERGLVLMAVCTAAAAAAEAEDSA